MYQVVPERLGGLRAFFGESPPNAPMLDACLDRRAPGRAFVDDFRAPTACVVAMNYSFVFLGGRPAAGFIERALLRLRRDQPLQVVWPDGRPPRAPAPDRAVDRIEFRERLDPAGSRLREASARMPEGGSIARIDAHTIERCIWRDEVASAAGSVAEFLAHGIGFCLVLAGRIVAEAYSCFWGMDRVEVAVVTHAEHRGRGYAGVVCARLIEACEAIGFKSYWSCDAANGASVRLARRLGFTNPREYRLLYYPQNPPPASR